jgi:hypothetical protein
MIPIARERFNTENEQQKQHGWSQACDLIIQSSHQMGIVIYQGVTAKQVTDE